jgi:putative glutamine amidotransferase
MKILISQREFVNPPHNFVYDGLERGWYSFLSKHQLIPVPNLIKIDTTIDFDCLILSGGNDSVNRHYTEDALFKHAIESNKPIVGICHGAFAVNDLTGGINGLIDGHHSSTHNVTIGDQTYLVNSFHSQTIKHTSDDMIVTAVDDKGNIEAFQHETLPIYGIVWHPERMSRAVLTPDVARLLL